MKKEFILNLDELDELIKILPREGVIILKGDLASGKTTLVKAIAKAHGVNSDVTSPTFSVMQGYENGIFHYDIYQNGFEGIIKNGLFENFFEEGLHLVEWGDDELENMLNKFNIDYIKICITPHEKGRKYEVCGA
ncbi:tRNA (adenosine(37)-N6)-threonylcarbamoyltransferase complex ATPase subunit type 1 TsaE [Campylobacter sp. CCUG 57310]|uniref:tRNA (adenosine(37)-N6)-threonylcarbamoyltransferase complex ATPase subunit type 1 TsaE n=1 Tax=Campylobacter sp. CCUG 57310 TaxID=2517362 RepID=UPI001565D7C8|nr:tRNA (adenosine(37)-N6)-threonylcarbamoyltransferase complex ATPase subunit type 1 TsaE [Campylobacter sp. CCUG 57310]QKF92268.1 N6-L-threonylcarbamoyladenine synthase, TsaE subunit [Campylobacter sp. CCUG 57310]